jgi:hypothetical protein
MSRPPGKRKSRLVRSRRLASDETTHNFFHSCTQTSMSTIPPAGRQQVVVIEVFWDAMYFPFFVVVPKECVDVAGMDFVTKTNLEQYWDDLKEFGFVVVSNANGLHKHQEGCLGSGRTQRIGGESVTRTRYQR